MRLELLGCNRLTYIFARVAAVVAHDIERGRRVTPGDWREGADQIRNVTTVEERAHEQDSVVTGCWAGLHSRGLRSEHQTPSSKPRRNNRNFRSLDAKPVDEFALRELRDRDDGAGTHRRLARHPAPPRAFAQAEPLGMGDERQIVNGDHDRWIDSKRRAIGRGEPDIEM